MGGVGYYSYPQYQYSIYFPNQNSSIASLMQKKKKIHLKASILNSIILYLNDNFQTFELLLRWYLVLKKLVSSTNQSSDLQCKLLEWFL